MNNSAVKAQNAPTPSVKGDRNHVVVSAYTLQQLYDLQRPRETMDKLISRIAGYYIARNGVYDGQD